MWGLLEMYEGHTVCKDTIIYIMVIIYYIKIKLKLFLNIISL